MLNKDEYPLQHICVTPVGDNLRKKEIGKVRLKQGYMVAHRKGSIFLQWDLKVIKEMEGKLTGIYIYIYKAIPLVYEGLCCRGRFVVKTQRCGSTVPSHKTRQVVDI